MIMQKPTKYLKIPLLLFFVMFCLLKKCSGYQINPPRSNRFVPVLFLLVQGLHSSCTLCQQCSITFWPSWTLTLCSARRYSLHHCYWVCRYSKLF
ncbi:hypothetical protein K435DRAFT_494675 [Dendrothele bispora CBS 962.96]|uniref:Secreted protein n=1 Tax=Dendrothele bispora (strain CBS 962.96) TaxID=1314807 RepID=A0A4S8KXA5_DENBC|nr:hypothetical protein K435DRAFT_494675 [Dendrothele bispora CBS 962.96]